MWGLLLHAFLYFLPEIPALRFRAPTRNFRRHRPPHAAKEYTATHQPHAHRGLRSVKLSKRAVKFVCAIGA